VTTNVTAKLVTFLHKTNHICTVVSHTCSCYTLIVSSQWPVLQYTTSDYYKNHWYHTGWNVGQKQLTTFRGL